jgi:nitroreductase/SAM-dependent methyltransferase
LSGGEPPTPTEGPELPTSSGPSGAEIRAAAEVAGAHRVSETGAETDAPAAGAKHGRVADRPAMDFWEVLYERRTTRRFDPERPVPRELVLELLDAALIAPTSCNLQMWDFVVVDDPDQREKLGKLSLQVLTAPVTIFVAYGKEYSEEGHANVQSAAAAMMTMSMAAHALGIGTFWINQLGPRDQVGAILGLPPDREVVAGLAVGWPKTYPTKVPRRRAFEHVVHWNHFAGQPIPSSPRPADWSLDLIRDYQHARVLNGNRYNKSRPWELASALSASDRLAPPDETSTPGEDAPRWLDVLPVTGLFTGAMSRRHRDHRWSALELSADVAAFAAKRCPAQVACEPVVYDADDVDALPGASFDRMTLLNRLEALPPPERQLLLASLHGMLRPGGRLLLQFTSKRSFHGIADWMHARRGGPGGVEYVLAPDPNLGPYEALSPGEVEELARRTGFRVVERVCEDAVPGTLEVEHRTRNMGGLKRFLVLTAVGIGRLLSAIPGVTRAFGRTRTLILDRG